MCGVLEKREEEDMWRLMEEEGIDRERVGVRGSF